MKQLQQLIDNYKQFYNKNFTLSEGETYSNFKDIQSPHTLFISCCDSRVNPTTIFKVQINEVFAIRNIANLVPKYSNSPNKHNSTESAIEYAVNILQVQNIVVIGHSNCGGIRTLIDSQYEPTVPDDSFIAHWLSNIESLKNKIPLNISKQQQYRLAELENLKLSLHNLKTYPWIQKKLQHNQISINAWHFSIGNGEILAFNHDTNQFHKL